MTVQRGKPNLFAFAEKASKVGDRAGQEMQQSWKKVMEKVKKFCQVRYSYQPDLKSKIATCPR